MDSKDCSAITITKQLSIHRDFQLSKNTSFRKNQRFQQRGLRISDTLVDHTVIVQECFSCNKCSRPFCILWVSNKLCFQFQTLQQKKFSWCLISRQHCSLLLLPQSSKPLLWKASELRDLQSHLLAGTVLIDICGILKSAKILQRVSQNFPDLQLED